MTFWDIFNREFTFNPKLFFRAIYTLKWQLWPVLGCPYFTALVKHASLYNFSKMIVTVCQGCIIYFQQPSSLAWHVVGSDGSDNSTALCLKDVWTTELHDICGVKPSATPPCSLHLWQCSLYSLRQKRCCSYPHPPVSLTLSRHSRASVLLPTQRFSIKHDTVSQILANKRLVEVLKSWIKNTPFDSADTLGWIESWRRRLSRENVHI